MKKLTVFFTFFALILLLIVPTGAANYPRVWDEAELLTDIEERTLITKLTNISEKHQVDVVVVTVESTDGLSPMEYADDFFDYNGYGYGPDASGIMLLVAMNDREWAVSTCGDAIRTVNNSEIDLIMNAVTPHLTEGEYTFAFNVFLSQVAIQYEAGMEPPNYIARFLLALLIGAAVAGISLLLMRSGMNTAKAQHGAANYMDDSTYSLYRCQDYYLYSRTTRVRKQQNSSSGTHRSSSGRSHGGRSGRF